MRDLQAVTASDELDGLGAQAVVNESPREIRLADGVADAWGRSESLDPDNVGDIADEGAGHRG